MLCLGNLMGNIDWNIFWMGFSIWCFMGMIGTGFDVATSIDQGIPFFREETFLELYCTLILMLLGGVMLWISIKEKKYKHGWRLWPRAHEWFDHNIY